MQFGLLFLIITAFSGCASVSVTEFSSSPADSVNHLVICWLKSPGDNTAINELIAVSTQLEEIPGVSKVSAGTAIPSERPIVDDSFDVAFLIVLEDETAMHAYLEHPIHLRAVEETLKPLVARILVYDF